MMKIGTELGEVFQLDTKGPILILPINILQCQIVVSSCEN